MSLVQMRMSLKMNYSKSYEELIKIPTFEDRLAYLMLFGAVGKDTFGYDRYLNQILYKSAEWRRTRNQIILRDDGCDLAVDGYQIPSRALIHHINPITVDDIIQRRDIVFDPNNLITTSLNTHEITHYGSMGDIDMLRYVERTPNDTCPWRK